MNELIMFGIIGFFVLFILGFIIGYFYAHNETLKNIIENYK